MNEKLKAISKIGIVPVIKIEQAEKAVPLAKALCEGGIPCAEVTFRTTAAPEAIRAMQKAFPDMLVGAGTVLTIEQVDQAVASGAQFIVSPGFDQKVLQYCIDRQITIVPGCSTPSEVAQAVVMGLEVVKFFPAEAAGGIPMLKALSGPFGNVKFMPTGGVNQENLSAYLNTKNVIACGGSWMVDAKMLEVGDFDGIRRLTGEAVSSMLGFEVAHIGINMEDEGSADVLTDAISNMFGFDKRSGSSSFFAGDGLEIMKLPYFGAKGHIAIRTGYIERAVDYLKRMGCEFREDSAKYDAENRLAAIYFKKEFGGFAFHLLQKK
ncbi:MAG: bifunctional 4-hydroxy-2-oxoglutarate aldolase/2-dehydro-3-deoxy-phosphogluconate aldolase [Lachnospiraceae bacterium]